ncbi:MAG: CinA family protein [Gammaproteobacteria bacterium]|nr:CinA family protein [Gammaproteobacteria bacterium]
MDHADLELNELAVNVGRALDRAGWMLATAESCTGGWVAQVITAISGSSAWFERGFVTYSDAAKRELLGVPAAVLTNHGAVSEPTARAMAEGARVHSQAQVALAVTGVAGPSGGSPTKPVGTVWFAWAVPGQATKSRQHLLMGDRGSIRRQSVVIALSGLLSVLP